MLHVVHSRDKQEDTHSEAQALARILSWSGDWPKWQRDALRRLCTQGELDNSDLDELTVLCKSRGQGGIVLAAEHLPDPGTAASSVRLRAIHGVENVNALKHGERLSFGKAGLTVVYGDNGSGKSGYARVLKKVCRARTPSRGDKILPNIYADKTGAQRAVIDFSVNGQNRRESWRFERPSDPLLSSVSVFDSRTANVHVDSVNDVAYTPFPLRVMGRLAEACREVKKRLDAEIRELEQRTPTTIIAPKCRPGTVVAKLIAELSEKTQEQAVHELATLKANEKERLEMLTEDLRKAPLKTARRLGGRQSQLEATHEKFRALEAALGDDRVEHLTQLHEEHQAARAAAFAAAGNLFAGEPLEGVGSDMWRTLWEAARLYSEKQAYRDLPFPNTRADARCVLCQQELDAHGRRRFTEFETFVRDATRRREAEAAAAYQAALNALRGCSVGRDAVQAATDLVRDELDDAELAQRVRRAGVTLRWRLRAVLREHLRGSERGALPVTAPWPSDELSRHAGTLSGRIATLQAEESSDEWIRTRAEARELADRQWLGLIKEDVIAEIRRRRERAGLEMARKDTATNRITTKSSEISERLVSNALRAKFSTEIHKLGVAGLAIELRHEKTTYGIPHFRVSLIRKPDAKVGEVLSEGEHRCVALAAFLAELATTESGSAIVFDDPISSLDHMHREAVAERLAVEGGRRQVLVFTHDIAFLFLVDQKCRDASTQVTFRCITRTEESAGFCQPDPPVRAQPLERVIDGMQQQLNDRKIHYDQGNQEKWERTVDMLQKRLRNAWERAVEEAVGPVVKRLSNKVETKGLAKVTMLTMEDCTTMREAYGRCSTLLHSSAEVLNRPLPKPEIVQKEIAALREWVEDVKERQGTIAWLR